MDTTMNERGVAAAAADGKRVVVMVERIKVKKRSNFETLIKFGTDACEFDALPSVSFSRTSLRALKTLCCASPTQHSSTACHSPFNLTNTLFS